VKKPGPKSGCTPETIELARKVYKLGALDAEFADIVSVDVRTVHRWKLEHPEFAKAVKASKKVVDDRIEASLVSRATGYTYDSEFVTTTQDGEVVRAPTVVHVPPDV
jgi:hypothetical protein